MVGCVGVRACNDGIEGGLNVGTSSTTANDAPCPSLSLMPKPKP